MAFRRGALDVSSAVRNPDVMENLLRDALDRLARLEKRTATESFSTQHRSPISSKPKAALVNVSGAEGKGRFQIRVRNPEFGNVAGTGRTTPKPLYHRVSYSSDPTFRTGVTELEPSPQTHYSFAEEPNQTVHVKIESSHDGVSWNLPQYQHVKI
jgi:hypothetical protein